VIVRAKVLASCVALASVVVVVAGPTAVEGEAQAQVYGQDEVCAERCRGATLYCFNECQKPMKECSAKCKVDEKHKSPKQFSREEKACLLACNTKTIPCKKGCGVQQHKCFAKCQPH